MAGGRVETHHIGELSVEGKGRVVEFVPVLTLAQCRDGFKFIAQGLPLGNVERGARVVALSTNALKAGSILAVVEGSVDENFRVGAQGVGARDHQVPLVQVPVAEQAARTFLCLAI